MSFPPYFILILPLYVKYKHEEAQRFLLVKLLHNCYVSNNHARIGISLPFLAGVRRKVEKQPQI